MCQRAALRYFKSACERDHDAPARRVSLFRICVRSFQVRVRLFQVRVRETTMPARHGSSRRFPAREAAARPTVLILSASMGSGHDVIAMELVRRLAAEGVEAEVVDILDLLPLRLGTALRGWYSWMMRSAPWLYALIYQIFFVPGRAPSVSPLTIVIAARLRRLVGSRQVAEVVSTFHVAAQAAGHLRWHGRLPVPSTVLLTDFAAHRLWLHPGNDRYLCPDLATAHVVHTATGCPVSCHAPVVRLGFRRPGPGVTPIVRPDSGQPESGAVPAVHSDSGRTESGVAPAVHSDSGQPESGVAPAVRPEPRPGIGAASMRSRIGARAGDRLVLVSAGAWGVGGVEETARVLARSGRYLPVILCGHNRELRRRLRHTGIALGWCDDMPGLMATAYALVDNAAGVTCREAMAAGVPVVSYRPIPGHGRDGARAMARAGLSVYARDTGELLAALDRFGHGEERDRQVARGAALFALSPAESFLVPPGL
ncbi:Monogalactosyldiacylglycerol (MGDG) synthase [Streptosporangium subroseum]|uniref:Monogalactosyldiacylglycerol (MGDG) synthase n=2 Tax=Streptosporangium subroseum TaxID=106412 RepID=A0A239BM90_9ACTN|nr:Monogalactosyldiacylglycerol (MGDG) synthase [Streptosporangium subroseum]